MKPIQIAQIITIKDEESIDRYFSDVSKIHLINTLDEENNLFRRIKQGDKIALKKIVESNLRFVISIAKCYQNRGLMLSDLISEGNIGLIKAVEKYDETRKIKFISYAVWWIRNAILDALIKNARMIKIPANKSADRMKMIKKVSEMQKEKGRQPTYDEIAESMDIDVDKLVKMQTMPLEILSDKHTDDQSYIESIYSQEPAPDACLINESIRKEILDMMKILNQNELDVLTLFFGLNGKKSLEEISDSLYISLLKVNHIKKRGLNILKKNKAIFKTLLLSN